MADGLHDDGSLGREYGLEMSEGGRLDSSDLVVCHDLRRGFCCNLLSCMFFNLHSKAGCVWTATKSGF